MIAFLAIFFLILAVWISASIYAETEERHRALVEETSKLLAQLEVINKRFSFDRGIKSEYKFYRKYNSKKKLDHCDFMDILDEFIQKYPDLLAICARVERNQSLYDDYCREISKLKSTATADSVKALKISYEKYIALESRLFKEKKLRPITDSTVVCMATYSSPKGRNNYSRTAMYDIRMLPQRDRAIKAKQIQQNSEEARRKRERALMTDKLRYSILKRDGFRCRICGRSAADGVKLHVDHIIPVSKGGKTVPNNLRTLCETCNWGKSDEIE